MHFVAHGRVQGVGYRAATQRAAASLGLKGWVRNRADGTVEGLAEGSPGALASLRDWLARGPEAAVVSKLEWLPSTARAETGFVIRY